VVHSSNCELWPSARPILGLNLGVTYAVDRRHGPNLINPQWPTIVAIKCYKNQMWLPLWVVCYHMTSPENSSCYKSHEVSISRIMTGTEHSNHSLYLPIISMGPRVPDLAPVL
jgi:hypothetical protein